MTAPLVRVTELAEQIRGVSYGKEDASSTPQPGYLPVLRAGNITDDGLMFDDLVFVPAERISVKQRIRRHDVVIVASSGSLDIVGKAAQALVDYEGGFGAFCKVLRPRSNVDPDYFAHFFKTRDYRRRVSALAAGININNLRNEHLDDMQIPLPPFPEQRRIADILDKAEELRAKRREALAQLDTLAQSTFLDMFGNPREKGSTGRIPTKVRTLGELTQIRTGRLDANAADEDGVYPFFTCAVEPLRINTPAFDCKAVLVAGNGDLNVKYYEGKFNAYQRTYVIESLNEAVFVPRFLYVFLEIYVSELRKQAIGGVIKYIKLPYLTEAEVRLPSTEWQLEFAHRVAAVERLTAIHRTSLAAFDVLFASLQDRTFRGEL